MTDRQYSQRLVAYRLGDTLCFSVTFNLDAVTTAPSSFRLIPGTKPYFSGNSRIGRDLVSYYHLPTFLGLASNKTSSSDDQPTTLITRDPLSSSTIGLQTDAILDFIPVDEVEDADRNALAIPAKLTPYCVGVVQARNQLWALIDLDQIIRDPNFRTIELPVQRP